MAVLIKGMQLPKSCYDCDFCRVYDEPNHGYFCIPLFADLHRSNFTKERIDVCPLVEVPENALIVDRHKLFNGEHNLYSWDEIEEAAIALELS
jgi:hypothetical protein